MWQKTVNDMYNHTKANHTPLLSSYNGSFWSDYVENYERYDKLFRRLYKSFWYFDQLYDDSISIVVTDFTDEVYNHLLVNNKKYSELYRIYVVDDDDFSIVDNYNIIENMDKESEKSGSDIYGQRSDSETDNVGARSDSKSESIGQRSDSRSESVGAHTNSKTETIGGRSDSHSETIGSRSDSVDYTQGSQSNQTTIGIEGFNSSSFQDSDRTTDSIGQRIDSTDTVTGQQSNSSSDTLGSQQNSISESVGAHTNTVTDTKGAQSNSESSTVGAQEIRKAFTKGSQSDTHADESSESYTLTRRGNIGIKTAQEVMKEQKEFWTPYEFYTYIFRDIAKELLMI